MKNATASKLNKILPLKSFKYVLFVVLSALQAIFSVGFAIAVKFLINAVENKLEVKDIITCGVILVAVVVITFILGVCVRILSENLQANAEYTLKNAIIKNFVNSSYSKTENVSEGDLVARINGDATCVSSVKVNLVPTIVSTIIRLVGTIVALFVMLPTFTLIILAVAVIIVTLSFFIRKAFYRLRKNTKTAYSNQSSFVSEVRSNSLAIKGFSAENYIESASQSKFEAFKQKLLKERYFQAFINSAINLVFTTFYAGAVVFGIYGIYKGDASVNFGSLIAVLQLVLQIKSPISGISGFFTAHTDMLVSAERLFSLVDDSFVNKEYLCDFESIKVENLSFSYGSNQVLNGVSLEINKGDKILIKGGSGEGKTTLVKAIAGLIKGDSGSVTIYSSGKAVSPDKVRGIYSFLPQGNMLFSQSIKDNIVFASEYNEEKFNKVLETAKIKDVIDSLPQKENTLLRKAVNLSEGQEQRLALARALYSDAPVVILDEPTSSLDIETEEDIVKTVCDSGKTLIVISHKHAFDGVAHKTITLNGGKII